MGYELHIERADAIRLEEWKAAVVRIVGVALRSEDKVVANSATGEEIRIPVHDGDAELDTPGGTIGVRWSSTGRASFKPPDDWDEPTCGVRRLVFDLAEQLGARVVGDEGEEYGPSGNLTG